MGVIARQPGLRRGVAVAMRGGREFVPVLPPFSRLWAAPPASRSGFAGDQGGWSGACQGRQGCESGQGGRQVRQVCHAVRQATSVRKVFFLFPPPASKARGVSEGI